MTSRPVTAPPSAGCATAPPVLAVDGVTVRFHEVLALRDVTVRLEAGSVCALLGVNGSGKSTLFGAIMEQVPVESGEVRIDGRSGAVARRAGAIAYMPQTTAVDWSFPIRVLDVVMTGRYGRLGPTRRARRADHVAVDDALERVGLADLGRRQIGALSGGQRRRVFLARALAQGARLLLLDEPFAGVDRGSQDAIVELLRSLRDEGVTALVATHDLAGVSELADQAVLLHQRVLAHGHPSEVLTPGNLGRVFGLRERPEERP